MTISQNARDRIEAVAQDALGLFERVAATAGARLDGHRGVDEVVLANPSSLTSNDAMRHLHRTSEETRRDLLKLREEPAIARVVVLDEDGEKRTYYISRGTPVGSSHNGALLASYRAPVGRLAALPVGCETTVWLPGGEEVVEVVERTRLRPRRTDSDWDSVGTVFEADGDGPFTVDSLRKLLGLDGEAGLDLVGQLLAEEAEASNLREGIRRALITKMGLRDQPILDRYQDEIFRLPLGSRLLILGPPGTGKTTTLIRRLGQKLDRTSLDEAEAGAVEVAERPGGIQHAQSWLMFTPTELLKQYVKEAFAREDIPASDHRIRTWAEYRREVARNTLSVLRTTNGGGPFVFRESASHLSPGTLEDQINWFSDFDSWQATAFWDERRATARALVENADKGAAALGRKLSAALEGVGRGSGSATLAELVAAGGEIQSFVGGLKAGTDKAIRASLNLQVNRDRTFVDRLADVLDTLSGEGEEADEEIDEEEDAPQPKAGRGAAMAAYGQAIRALARAQVQKRAVGKASRNGRILEWLGDCVPTELELLDMGESLVVQGLARRFANPVQKYLGGIPARYRRYRRLRQSEGRWYKADGFNPGDLDPLEADVIILSVLSSAEALARERRIVRDIEAPAYEALRALGTLYKNQILVDEVADFSPVQLACMAGLSVPGIDSFFACGDFNQRVTAWGSRSVEQVRWACPGIDVKAITVAYRQSRQLNDFARRIVATSGDGGATLPEHVDNEGVMPVLGRNLPDHPSVAAWLARRIAEIEVSVRQLPSVAVLVNGEGEVHQMAECLNEALADMNIRAVACPNGQVIGQDNDVRVFDVQHIKGLEFEAVFFVGVDTLAADHPQLFDKYLYVGATRAATYLGLTTGGTDLPQGLASLASLLGERWDVAS
ncbi:ATP-binding domain-containing protein [Arenibaculum sp.]|jgi:DNA polymerase III delta prime subunit|uniref:ATP-binding domain-containing protein n=1 Tax=Arenibaculum sp. TaxID=2865862 RepID=UPI002E156194|nr:ATP-binding domain-containing protein [Arenibaculum sp.]